MKSALRALVLVTAALCACSDSEQSSGDGRGEAAIVEAPNLPRRAKSSERAGATSVTTSVVFIHDVEAPGMPSRSIEILVPGQPAPAGGWPFLVVTDGDLAATRTFAVHATLRALVDEGVVPPTVVIAVPSRVRRNRELSVRARAFADFLAEVVLPVVDAQVPLAPTGSVLGYSFGGLAAVYAGVRHSERFHGVIAMSPSLWFRQGAAFRELRRARSLPRRWWIDIGTREGRPREAVPYMVADARRLRDDLLGRGLELGTEVGYFEAPGRAHHMREAGQRMRMALTFSLGEPGCAPGSLTLHVFDDELSRGRAASTSVELQCTNGQRITPPNRDVEFRQEGGVARITRNGVWRARRVGMGSIHARFGGLSASAPVQVVP